VLVSAFLKRVVLCYLSMSIISTSLTDRLPHLFEGVARRHLSSDPVIDSSSHLSSGFFAIALLTLLHRCNILYLASLTHLESV
jgi:hypothetical protein